MYTIGLNDMMGYILHEFRIIFVFAMEPPSDLDEVAPMKHGASVSSFIGVVISFLVGGCGDVIVNVKLFGMSFDPGNFERMTSFGNQAAVKLLPKVSIVNHAPIDFVIFLLVYFYQEFFSQL